MGSKTVIDFNGMTVGESPVGFLDAGFPYDGPETNAPFAIHQNPAEFPDEYVEIEVAEGSRYYYYDGAADETDSAVEVDVRAFDNDEFNRQPSVFLRCVPGHQLLELRWANDYTQLELYDVDLNAGSHVIRARIDVPTVTKPGTYTLWLRAFGKTAFFRVSDGATVLAQGQGSTLTTQGKPGIGVHTTEF